MIPRLVIFAASVVIFAACAGTDPEGEVASPTPAPGARAGGELTVGIVEPTSIDPALVPPYDEAGTLVVQTMCDPLIGLDPETGDPVPVLAKEWEIVGGGTKIVVTLKDDLEFSNGDAVDSGDVVRSIARVADPALGSPNSALLDDVAGYDDLLRGEAEDDLLEGVEVSDPYGFEITLGEPRSEFYRLLTTSPGMPVPEDLIGDSGPSTQLSQQPVCSGPYRMTEPWELGDSSIVLERVDDYHAENAALTRGGEGWADRITFRIYPDRAAAFAALERGVVDVAPIPNEKVAEAREMKDVTVEQSASPILEYIGFPVTLAPYDLRAVRVAISKALDRKAIVEKVYGGSRIAATGMLPPTIGDDYFTEDACGDNAPLTADVEGAQAALEEAGVAPEDLSGPIYYNDDFDNEALVREVAAQLRRDLGIALTPKKLGFTEYIEKGKSGEGFDGPFRLAWGMPYPSADEFLAPLFATAGIGVENLTRFSNPEFDEVLNERAREATTEEDLHDALGLLETIACEEMPVAPIVFGAREYAVRSDVLDSAVGRLMHRSFAQPLLRELYLVP